MDDERHMMDLHNETGRRWATAALVGAALLSAAYWTEATLLRFRQGLPAAAMRPGATQPSPVPAASTPPPETLAKLLGAQPRVQAAPLGPADRFKVMGVIASASGRGTALIAVDGQAPRPYSVGAELAPGFVLQAVKQKELTLTDSNGAVLATLPLPEPGATSGIANAGSGLGVAGAAGAPPIVNGSRGNPRSVEAAPPAGLANAPSQGTAPTAPPNPTP